MLGLNIHTPVGAVWWPEGAIFAADFVRRRYMRLGANIAEADAISLSRATPKYAIGASGLIETFAPGTPAFVGNGLLLEPAATNLNPRMAHSNTAHWTSVVADVTPDPGTYLGFFSSAGRVASTGNDSGRRETAVVNFVAGTTYAITFWYAAGTSGRAFLSARVSSSYAVARGPAHAPVAVTGSLGDLIVESIAALGGGVMCVRTRLSPTLTSPGRLGVGPDTATAGQDIVALGCQIQTELNTVSVIPTEGDPVATVADLLTVTLPDQHCQLYQTHADGSASGPVEYFGPGPLSTSSSPVSMAWAVAAP